MRILGVDYGDSRIGVAVSDTLGFMAHAVETIHWKNDWNKPLERILQLVAEYKADRIVVGFPRNMNGTVGPRGEKTLEFIEQLKQKTEVEVVRWDERLTTVAANRLMHETGVKTSRKKQVVDQIAAVYILQGYLDSLKK